MRTFTLEHTTADAIDRPASLNAPSLVGGPRLVERLATLLRSLGTVIPGHGAATLPDNASHATVSIDTASMGGRLDASLIGLNDETLIDLGLDPAAARGLRLDPVVRLMI